MKIKIILIFIFFINLNNQILAQRTDSVTLKTPKIEYVIIGVNSSAEVLSNNTLTNETASIFGLFGEIKMLPMLSFVSSVNYGRRSYFIIETSTPNTILSPLKTERDIAEDAFTFEQVIKYHFQKKNNFSYFFGLGAFLKSVTKSKTVYQRTPDTITGYVGFQKNRRYSHALVGGIVSLGVDYNFEDDVFISLSGGLNYFSSNRNNQDGIIRYGLSNYLRPYYLNPLNNTSANNLFCKISIGKFF